MRENQNNLKNNNNFKEKSSFHLLTFRMTFKNVILNVTNKFVAITLIAVLLFSPLGALAEEYNGAVNYDGIQTYKALYNNINFTDVKNHWAKEPIYRMSALSIIRGLGSSKYGPSNTLTREEAIALIVRIMGMETEAQAVAVENLNDSDTAGYKILTASDYWADGYTQIAVDTGIVTQDELTSIEQLTESEAEALELQLDSSMESYESNDNLTNNQIANIRAQLEEKLEKKYTWKKPARREEVAVWISRVVGLTPINGQNQQMIYNLKDWTSIKTENLPLIEAILQEGIMQGNDNGEFKPTSPLNRAEMAKILDSIHTELLINQGYKINTGIVERIDSVVESSDGITKARKIFLIRNDDSTMSTIVVQESDNDMYDKGFVAYKNEKITLPPDINEYDYIKYYVNPEGEAVLVEEMTSEESLVEGTIEELDIEKKTIVIKDYYDKIYSFKISEGVDVRINDLWAELKDFLYGQEVSLTISNGNVIELYGYLDTGDEGYIHPGEKIHIGKVLYVDKNDGKVTLLEEDLQQDFIIDSFTPVIKNNVNVGIEGIKEGDILRLEFDQYQGNFPIKAYIAQPDRQITALYKGTISQYNPNRNEIVLESASIYDNTKWQKQSGDIKLPLSYDSSIYVYGRNISKELIQSYLGREAYIATDQSFSKEQAIKVVFKSGYEKKFYNSIQEIAFGDQKLRVDYNEMYFDDSTIIIKEGKLIHPYNLKEDDEVFVVSHGTGNYTASLISIEEIIDTGYVVYRGRIDEISQYSFELDNFDIIEGTDKDYSSRNKELNISEDTVIIDTRDDEIEEISVEEFTNSRFLKGKGRSKDYYDEYTYAIGYGDMIIAMDIIERGKEGQVISSSNIKEIDTEEDIITLKETRDYSEFTKKWNVNKAEIELEVSEAMFIKNGRAVSIYEISESDSLYIIRRNDVGYIVICR